MQEISASQYALWILSPLLLFAIVAVHRRAGRSGYLQWFMVYLLWVGLSSYVQLGLRFWSTPYFGFFFYWIAQGIAVLLSFVVLYEVARNVLTSGTLPFSKSNFMFIIAVLLVMAATLALKIQGGDTEKFIYTILVFARTARFVQVGFMLLLVALSLLFGFYWSSQAFGIASGFGLYAAIELINSSVRAMLGPTANLIFGWVSVLSYQLAALIWVAYALKGRKSPVMELPENKLPQL
ncbi:MAG: hypothetical protein JWO13_2956 [Acidobacteriales bacterium]|nr:hypothetical protein [Terriglobales bacterium]